MKIVNALLIAVIVTASVFFFSDNKADPDLWGHLKFGQDIYRLHAVPRYDSYSYTAAGAPWINHEWLSELIFYAIFKTAKGAGLIIFKVLIGLLMTSMIYASVRRRTKRILLRFLCIGASISVIGYGFATRPQIFTFLFFTAALFFIDKFEATAKAGWLAALAVIILLWCNLHGGFVAGLGALFIYAAIKSIQRKASPILMVAVVISFAVTLLNPYGIWLWAFLLEALSRQRPYISEWGKVGGIAPYADYYALVLITALGVAFSKHRRSAYEMAILSAGVILSFLHNRHVALFAIAASIYAPGYLDSAFGGSLERLEARIPRRFFIVVFLCLSIFFMASAVYKDKTDPFKIEIPQDTYPVNAVAFIKANKITGNIFCWFDWAEMCIRELPDANKVFFDGRYETVYGDPLVKGYFDTVYCRRDYKEYLGNFPPTDIMLLHASNPLAAALSKDREWIMVYDSFSACVYLRDNKNNERAIEKFRNNSLARVQSRPPFYFK